MITLDPASAEFDPTVPQLNLETDAAGRLEVGRVVVNRMVIGYHMMSVSMCTSIPAIP